MRVRTLLLLSLPLLLLSLPLLMASTAEALTIDPSPGTIGPVSDDRGLSTSASVAGGLFGDSTTSEAFPSSPFAPFEEQIWSHLEHPGINGSGFANQRSQVGDLRLSGTGGAGSWGSRGGVEASGEFTGESRYEVVFATGSPLSWNLLLELNADQLGEGTSFASFELVNLDTDQILAQFFVEAGESLLVEESGELAADSLYALRAIAFSSSRVGGATFSSEGHSGYHFGFEVVPGAVPEPGTALLLGASLAGLGLIRRRGLPAPR